ncbi:MAG: hypothetical protein RIK87_04335 [Fuerstiella sp.]
MFSAIPHISESLEFRQLLTDLSGVITTDTAFTDPNDQINIVGDVLVRNGARLTFGAGVIVQEGSSFHDIFVGDDGSAAGLFADGATLNVDVVMRTSASGNLANNTVNRRLTLDGGASSQLLVTDNVFNVTPVVHPEYVPRLADNTFPAGSIVGIGGGDITVDTAWPVITGVAQYRMFSDVRVQNGSQLTIATGAAVQEDSSFHDLFVGSDGSAAGLTADAATFSVDVLLQTSATGVLTNNTFNRTVTIGGDATSQLDVSGNTFNVTPQIHPGYIPRLADNSFPAGSIVGVTAGDVTVDTTWPVIAGVSQFRLFGDVRVRNGAALTVADGLAVQEDSSFHDLFVGDDGSAAALFASNVQFAVDVVLRNSATGQLTGNSLNRGVTIDGGAGSQLIVTGNTVTGSLFVHPEYVPRIRDNSFQNGSVVGINSGNVTVDTVWRVIPNVSQYRLFGDVSVRNGATLIVPDGITVQENSSFQDLFVGGDGSAAELLARDVVFIADVVVQPGAKVDLSWVEHRRNLTLNDNTHGTVELGSYTSSTLLMNAGSNVVVRNANLASGTVEAIRNSGTTIDLTGNWWGTTNPVTIEQKTLHQPDDNRRPLVNVEPFLTSAPTMPTKIPPGFTISQTDGSTSVNETGTSDSFTVVLNSQPLLDVVLEVQSQDTDEVSVSPGTLRFTRDNWNQPQSLQVTGVDDPAVDGAQQTNVVVSILVDQSDDAFENVASQSVSVTTLDNDVAGMTVQSLDGTTVVNESGTQRGFTVRLNAQPLSDVVIQVVSSDLTEATVSPQFLTFTPEQWNLPQSGTITGVDDQLADGSQQSTLTFKVVDAQSNNAFDNVADQQFSVTTQDNDLGFTIAVTDEGTTVTEAGGQDTFTVVLDGQPLADVVLSLSSGTPSEVTVETSQLIFTPANWDQPQQVTVTGVDDTAVDGTRAVIVTIEVRTDASHAAFHGLPPRQLTVLNSDDEVASFSVRETDGGTSVGESAGSDSFSVVLDVAPVDDVTFVLSVGQNPDAEINRTSLTFTPADWDQPQVVTVIGRDDAVDDGDTQTVITVSVDDSLSSAPFRALADQTVTVTTIDDEERGITVSAISGDTTEAGGTATFTVVLNSEPVDTVSVRLSSADTTEGTVSTDTLSFTPQNWHLPQTVTVTGVDDEIDDGSRSFGIVLEPATGGDYQGIDPDDVVVTNTDDDTAAFTLSSTTAVVSEDGTSTVDSISLTLDTEPESDVVLVLTLSENPDVVLSRTQLTFTPADWNVAQDVTISGLDDGVVDGSELTTITVSIDAAASDDAFDGLPPQSVIVTTTDDDIPAGDVDGNSAFDANDSFLAHLVMLSGTDSQIDSSKGGSHLSAAEIRALIDGISATADVDGDGDFDANDSFLIHLVKLSGTDFQIDQAKGSSSLSAAEIRSRIDALNQAPVATDQTFSQQSEEVRRVLASPGSSFLLPEQDLFERLRAQEPTVRQSIPIAPDEAADSDTVWTDFRSWIDAI